MNKSAPILLQQLPRADLERLTTGGQILEADGLGPKVYQLGNGLILKIFRQRRLFSSATLFPYARRFIRNAQRLEAAGIATISPVQYFDLPEKRTTAVLYRPLPGATVAQLVRNGQLEPAIIRDLAHFIRHLHEKGIYFRSLHIGNIVRTPDQRWGLIDIADMSFRRKSLSRALIERNFRHFKRQLDRFCAHYRCEFPWQALREAYEAADS
ncbi:lipopolysaccharide kinase InaA family protein [Pseudomonas oryzae]|uniref:Lipopolysaccharide kinase (Kdo/WaaP) family protein n=1 Tax=Pseudomonas oryzae TaxID=1392877 RepID=A0A1H1VVB2_9PSED|nr:lipopolysaccharide kinase InaA family protein [Pseudomonas oryzae]SDS88411.1 Lipopolysaccharide kinase (Kdo/WaaP) family protein [Pseudomonas oryzae]